jgi:hemerythrin-like metal-binding protein
MAFLSWHARYTLGHADIDTQHRKLFELVNHFDEVNKMGMTEELPRILEDILTYTLGHFRFEEELMEKVGFPQLSGHQKVHVELIRQARDMQEKMKRGGHVSATAVARFLSDWLTNHIIREDMEYRPYLKAEDQ